MPTINTSVTRSPHVAGGQRVVVGSYTGPASYVSGGDAIAPGDLGLGDIEYIDFTNPVGGQILSYNFTTNKVIWLAQATGVEVAGGVALNGQTVRFRASGK